jgi:hypothetical protein
MIDVIKPKGFIRVKIKFKDTGETKVMEFHNMVLNSGKEFLAKCLLEGSKPIIANILFGDGGTEDNGQPKEVSPNRDKLHGITRVKKSVIAQIDPDTPTQVIFSMVIDENEGNEYPLNEMGLELSDGTLFSLSTFANLNKNDQMEISYWWFVSFV